MISYAKFYLCPLLSLVCTAGFMIGGQMILAGLFMAIFLMVFCELLLGHDTSELKFSYPTLLKLPLYFCLPLMLLLHLAVSNYLGQALLHPTASSMTHGLALLGVVLVTAGYGVVVSHELVHQTRNLPAVFMGRMLLAMIFNPDFSISHVFIHHAFVGTDRDPATAKRGENVYHFFWRSSVYSHLAAWRFEADRLRRKGGRVISLKNRLMTGYLLCLFWPALYCYFAGPIGGLLFVLMGLLGKFLFEAINYVEHYGLSRKPGVAVAPFHSWNSNHSMSYSVLIGLSRHSAHHEKASLPYWKLKSYQDAPQMPYGYLVSVCAALLPPYWFRLMRERLNTWDRKFA